MGGDIGVIQLGSERELCFALPDYSIIVRLGHRETTKIILWETYTPRPKVLFWHGFDN